MKYFILVSSLLLAKICCCQNLQDGLLIHYALDGNSVDDSQNGYDGTEYNITYTMDEMGSPISAAEFNGANSHIDFPNLSSLKPDLPITFSLKILFYDISSNSAMLVTNNFGTDVHSGIWMNVSSNGKLAIGYGDGGITTAANRRTKEGGSTIITNVWYNLTGVVRGPTDMDIYIDCVNDGGTYSGFGGALFYTPDQGNLGRKDNGGTPPYYLNGIISDFRYWDRALTEEEILMLCTSFSLNITTQTDPLCTDQSTGTIEVEAIGGAMPITYSIDGGAAQDNGLFNDVSAGLHTITATDANGSTTFVEVELDNPTPLTIDLVDIVNPNCNGENNGSFEVIASGGTTINGSYTFTINGANSQSNGYFENLSAGNYELVAVDDNGCESFLEVELIESLPLVLRVIELDNESCPGANNGLVQILASGGTPGYTYSLDGVNFYSDNVFSDLPSGSYLIQAMDANGCTAFITITIDVLDPFTILVVNILPETCMNQSDGLISITTIGAAGPVQYAIDSETFGDSGVFQNLTSGLHTVYAMDVAGCIQSLEVIVPLENEFLVELEVADILCYGNAEGQITISVTGNENYIYSIDGVNFQSDPVFTDLLAGDYTVFVESDAGCESSQLVTISQPPLLTVVANGIEAPSCPGNADASIVLVANGGVAPYVYYLNGVSQSNSVFADLSAGIYLFTVIDSNGCESSVEYNLEDPIGFVISIVEIQSAGCDGEATGQITVATDATGTTIYQLLNETNTTGIFNNVPSGIYTIMATDDNGCSDSIEVVINELSSISISDIIVSSTTCSGTSDGSLTVIATGGTGSLIYTLDGQFPQNNGIYTNLSAGSYVVAITDEKGCSTAQVIEIEEPMTLSLELLSLIHPDCNEINNGHISVSVSGGESPYQYYWDGMEGLSEIDNLTQGTYELTTIDNNGCTASITVELVLMGEIELYDISTTDISCKGESDGTVIISLVNDNSLYTFTLGSETNNTGVFSNLAAGSYPVTIGDDEACQIEIEVIIKEPVLLEVIITDLSDVDCNGILGAFFVEANGGVEPYNIYVNGELSPGLNDSLVAGIYEVNVIDAHGCESSLDVTISESNMIMIESIDITDVSCFGESDGSINISVESNFEVIYTLDGVSNNDGIFENLPAGHYNIDLIDSNGCTTQIQVEISQPEELIINVTEVDFTSANGGSISVSATGGTGPYRYSKDNESTIQQDSSFTNLEEGTYTIIVIDENGCMDSTTVSPTNVINPKLQIADISIYPVPANDRIVIDLNMLTSQFLNIALLDINGKTTLVDIKGGFRTGANTVQFNVGDIPSGLYLINIRSASAQYWQKVIITK